MKMNLFIFSFLSLCLCASESVLLQDSRALRGSGDSAAVSSFCPLTARAQRRRERERREEEQQRRKREGMQNDLSLKVRRTNKV